MRRRPLLLALAGSATALPPHASRAACTRPLQVGVSLLGWGAYEEGGQLRGIVPDLVAQLGARSDCRLELQLRPRARVMLDFQNRQLDLVTSAQRTPERDAAGDFLPYAFSGFDLVARPELREPLDSVAALGAQRRLRLGMVRGIQLSPALTAATERLLAEGRVEWATDFQNLAARLQAGRFQVAIFPTVIHGKLIRDGVLPPQFRVIELGDNPPTPIGLYLHRERLAAALRQRLQQSLLRLVRDGEIERIYARYIGEPATQRLFEAGRAAAARS